MSEASDPYALHAQAARRLDADVGVEHIAEVYARALVGAADGAGVLDEAVAELERFVDDVLVAHPKLEAILGSELVSYEEKAGIIDRLVATRASVLMVHFLKVVGRHGRLGCLRAIRRQARRLLDQRRGRVRVELRSAAPLDTAAIARVTDQLRTALRREPVVVHRVDPKLIGGAVLRIGDTVYDGSVARQLQSMRQRIIDRSAHEIQSRRDRFRDPAGD